NQALNMLQNFLLFCNIKAAFFNCNLKEINLPNILKIEEMAFCNCKILANVTMTSRYMEIDKTAFCGCDLLKDVNWI
ncbi:leucine-rich repeat protein, partial [bacterium]|nr:leucine-rich repeat protein [bacterium]